MEEPVRYGVIGTGLMGTEHLRNLALVPGAKVNAFADPNAESRRWARLVAPPEAQAYEDYRDLLANAEVDAVIIASPNFTHAEILSEVFKTHKHVLIEQPLCTKIDDCMRVVEAAASHRGIVWVGMEYRFMRPVERLVHEVGAGSIGQLKMLAIREHRYPFLPKVDDWNRFAENTGGTLVEKCCHFFDLMNLITEQRPIRVYASGGHDVNHLDERYGGRQPDILDNAFAIVDFDGGARALLDLCMFAENSKNEMEIAATGSEGKIEAFIPAHELILTRRDSRDQTNIELSVDREVRHAGAHHGSTFFEHMAFLEAIRKDGKPIVSVEDGALAVAVGVAAERSVREGRPVQLSELGF